MSDRFHALTVTLDHDVHEADIERLTGAIRMIRGVADVTPHVAGSEQHLARMRVRTECRVPMVQAITAILDGRKVTIEERSG